MLLAKPLKTLWEEELMNALCDADWKIGTLRQNNHVLQAQVVLQDLYVGMACAKLQSQEEEKKSKGKSKKLNADGLLKLLDRNEFCQRVVKDNEWWKLEEAEKVQEQAAQGVAGEVKKKLEEEEAHKLCNNEATDAWQEAVKLWEIEQDREKEACQRPRWKKLNKPKAEHKSPRLGQRRAHLNKLLQMMLKMTNPLNLAGRAMMTLRVVRTMMRNDLISDCHFGTSHLMWQVYWGDKSQW